MFRQIIRTPALRVAVPAIRARPAFGSFNKFVRNYSDHHEETYEEFTTRFEKEFEQAYDLFEVQRVLNNAFSYDLVPAPSVIEKALLACRRVNDYATAVRVFEGLKVKVDNNEQYEAYLEELKDVRKELGVDLKEDLFPESA
ncbi:cytochrome c oxidase subunit VI [Saccharomycopsis crataegensis]|uniref:Cytochrome c oxidase subunit 6, mitochondrial n=1 Tax=Saccharomycopsis crataegensis TaxID=43959 RepID=A0AAV5QIE4_9ASCO|nr:cytochrome c oxidase subunit VI [Saccharomycopsis crataegensis]